MTLTPEKPSSVTDLQATFPALKDFSVTSPIESRYNCIAWAAGLDGRWWWPHEDYFWPSGVLMKDELAAFISAFSTLGYELCADGALEDGFEKVAIYQASSGVKHAARQLHTGRWTSKLGNCEDIEHASPDDLEGAQYGKVVQYMRRPTVKSPHCS